MARSQHNAQRVEEGFTAKSVSQALQSGRQHEGKTPHVRSDASESLWTVIDRIHRGHIGEQRLRCANVAGGFLSSNVLLARLEGQAVRWLALGIFGNADQTARHLAFERVARGEKGGVRTAVAERHAETLGASQGHIRAKLTGWGEQGEA